MANVARARDWESGLQDKIHITQTTLVEPCPNIRHQSFKCPKTKGRN